MLTTVGCIFNFSRCFFSEVDLYRKYISTFSYKKKLKK